MGGGSNDAVRQEGQGDHQHRPTQQLAAVRLEATLLDERAQCHETYECPEGGGGDHLEGGDAHAGQNQRHRQRDLHLA